MIDIIYFGDSTENQEKFSTEIKEKFPSIKLSNADDYIKGLRTTVEMEKCDVENYKIFLFGKGWSKLSLMIALDINMDPSPENINRLIRLANEQYPKESVAIGAV